MQVSGIRIAISSILQIICKTHHARIWFGSHLLKIFPLSFATKYKCTNCDCLVPICGYKVGRFIITVINLKFFWFKYQKQASLQFQSHNGNCACLGAKLKIILAHCPYLGNGNCACYGNKLKIVPA